MPDTQKRKGKIFIEVEILWGGKWFTLVSLQEDCCCLCDQDSIL